MRNHVKAKLKSGETVIGVNVSVMDPDSIRTISNSDFDWLMYDTEHGPWSIETVNNMIQQTSGLPASPIIRVVWNDANAIKRALDTGAFGIIVPWISSKDMAEDAVRFSKYPPEGMRGCAPGRPARAWGVSGSDYINIANEEILIAIQIERIEAIEKIEDILSVDGIDATWLGPSDLSASMGLRGQRFHPKVLKAMDKMLEACIDAGVAPGIAGGAGVREFGVDYVSKLIEDGFKFINVGPDTNILRLGCEEFIRRSKL